jgi:glutamyl-Q tRNA(Asp) synthetase
VKYVGRFAPSPTGPLHAGSIATAVASFLQARQNAGQWLLRIDDLDPPRCVPGSAESIVALLERLELYWDDTVYYQSDRSEAHAEVAAALLQDSAAFRCDCSRRDLLQTQTTGPLGIPYDGRCRDRDVRPGDSAVRVRVESGVVVFEDRLQGTQHVDLASVLGDYVVFRRDDLPAYHLAAVLDDADQGVTDVVRGSDLLAGTAVQVHLAGLLGLPEVAYWHLPVLCNAQGEKLSKQHQAASVESMDAAAIAFAALRHIGAAPPLQLEGAPPAELWHWGTEHWRIETLAGQMQRVPEQT